MVMNKERVDDPGGWVHACFDGGEREQRVVEVSSM